MLHNSAWPKDTIQQLETKLKNIGQQIDYRRMQDSLAIFVSTNISKLFLLPFQVKEKIIIDKKFEIRDLIYYVQFLKPYYLLVVSKKWIRLYKGEGRDLQEIINDDFPKQYIEEYEYAHPSMASSSSSGLKDYERDKSVLQEIRQKAFIKKADDAMAKYLKGDTVLLVAGVEEELANFEHITHHRKFILGKIQGNYTHDAPHTLSEIAWKKMNQYIKALQQKHMLKLREDIGNKMAIDGIRNVWKAAKEGNGLKLLV